MAAPGSVVVTDFLLEVGAADMLNAVEAISVVATVAAAREAAATRLVAEMVAETGETRITIVLQVIVAEVAAAIIIDPDAIVVGLKLKSH